MSTVDTLLDAAANDGKVIITVDEPSRTLNYDGTILLGVEDDHKAERIYFQAPRYITMDETVDLLSDDIEIYVKYINAENGTYYVQCTDAIEGEEVDTIIFSWVVSETVTEAKGKVQFSVWFRKVEDSVDENGDVIKIITKQWHTTIFTGTILDGIETDYSTNEVIASETATTYMLIQKVDELQETFDEYTGPTMTEVNARCELAEQNVDQRCQESEEYTETYVQTELKKYLDSSRVEYQGAWVDTDQSRYGVLPILVDQAEYPTVTSSDININEVMKVQEYKLENKVTLGYGNFHMNDIYDYVGEYNDIMIILAVTNNNDNNIPLNINLVLRNDTEERTNLCPVQITGNSSTTKYIKMNINRTDDDGYSCAMMSSDNEYKFQWTTIADVNEMALIGTIGENSGTGILNIVVKIYGR